MVSLASDPREVVSESSFQYLVSRSVGEHSLWIEVDGRPSVDCKEERMPV